MKRFPEQDPVAHTLEWIDDRILILTPHHPTLWARRAWEKALYCNAVFRLHPGGVLAAEKLRWAEPETTCEILETIFDYPVKHLNDSQYQLSQSDTVQLALLME